VIGNGLTMPEVTPPPGMSEEDWAATPVTVRVLVMEWLQRRARLEARLNQTSRNSSKPPAADPPSAKPRAAKVPSGRTSGGQPGHEGRGRKLKPEREVDQVIDVRPEQWRQCGALVLGDEAEPERPQVTDCPRIVPVGTEYRRHCLGGVAA
jgi:transposase